MILQGYAQELTSASGALVNAGQLAGIAEEITSASGQLIIERAPIQPFPRQDASREERILTDLADLMHAPRDDDFDRRALRWIGHVLAIAARGRKWWFLENVAGTTLKSGADMIDLRGHVDRVAAVYAPKRLHLLSLAEITELRQAATVAGRPNAGEPTHYANEAGRRIHLWPAPATATRFAVLYQRPMAIELVPDEWESIIVDGVLGRYGRHFDRDALTQDPAEFERRFYDALRTAGVGHWDIERARRWDDVLPPGSTLTAQSTTHSATDYVVPASMTGIGYVSVETGDYPMEVS
jgi:hypothetical protein